MKLVGQTSTTVTQSFARVYMASAQTLTKVWVLCHRYKVGSDTCSVDCGKINEGWLRPSETAITEP